MPSIITTTQKKEKMVAALLSQYDLPVEHTSFAGMLICKQTVDPKYRDFPHVTGIITISDQEAERLTAGTPLTRQDLIRKGSHIVVTQGDYEKCHGIVRYREGDTAMVDINYLGKMFAIKLPLSEISLPTEHTFWE